MKRLKEVVLMFVPVATAVCEIWHQVRPIIVAVVA